MAGFEKGIRSVLNQPLCKSIESIFKKGLLRRNFLNHVLINNNNNNKKDTFGMCLYHLQAWRVGYLI